MRDTTCGPIMFWTNGICACDYYCRNGHLSSVPGFVAHRSGGFSVNLYAALCFGHSAHYYHQHTRTHTHRKLWRSIKTKRHARSSAGRISTMKMKMVPTPATYESMMGHFWPRALYFAVFIQKSLLCNYSVCRCRRPFPPNRGSDRGARTNTMLVHKPLPMVRARWYCSMR